MAKPALPSELRSVLDAAFSWLPHGHGENLAVRHEEAATLAAVLDLADRIPEYLITLNPVQQFHYLRSVAAIRDALSQFRGLPPGARNYEAVLNRVSGDSPLYTLRHLLEKCQDSVPAPGTSDLPFFQDTDLRNEIRSDLSEVEEAFASHEYKAATILGGAVLDSIIYWALTGLGTHFPGRPLNERMLGPLIDLARSEGLITDRTRDLAKLAKDARNLIHAGVGDRERQQCDKSSSHSVLSAIEATVTDIADFCRTNNRQL